MKEIRRFIKVYMQTIGRAGGMALLFFAVFTLAMGGGGQTRSAGQFHSLISWRRADHDGDVAECIRQHIVILNDRQGQGNIVDVLMTRFRRWKWRSLMCLAELQGSPGRLAQQSPSICSFRSGSPIWEQWRCSPYWDDDAVVAGRDWRDLGGQVRPHRGGHQLYRHAVDLPVGNILLG